MKEQILDLEQKIRKYESEIREKDTLNEKVEILSEEKFFFFKYF